MRRHIGWPLTFFTLILTAAELRAQWPYYPPDWGVSGSGVSFTYTRRSYSVSGYVSNAYGLGGFYPPFGRSFGYSQRQVIVQQVVTPIILQPPPAPEPDLSPLDLDVIRPSRRFPARAETPPERVPPPEPPPLPGIDISRPKPPPRPEDKPPPLPVPPAPKPPPTEEQRAPDDPWRLMDLGKAAFLKEEFGKAAWRFRQVTEVAPTLALGYFLRAQAEFALGKHRAAVRAIEDGLRRKPGWPAVATFRPRQDLYKGFEAEFDAHLKRLADATKEQPLNADLLFLYAYQLWFDGRRAEAITNLERARAVAADTTFIDRFLHEAGWKVAKK
jgi:hypothetical protein